MHVCVPLQRLANFSRLDIDYGKTPRFVSPCRLQNSICSIAQTPYCAEKHAQHDRRVCFGSLYEPVFTTADAFLLSQGNSNELSETVRLLCKDKTAVNSLQQGSRVLTRMRKKENKNGRNVPN
jgi:hypothetical protein